MGGEKESRESVLSVPLDDDDDATWEFICLNMILILIWFCKVENINLNNFTKESQSVSYIMFSSQSMTTGDFTILKC